MAAVGGANAAKPLTIRLYQLLCTICSMGADDTSESFEYSQKRDLDLLQKLGLAEYA